MLIFLGYSSFAVVCNALRQFDETERVILVDFFGVKAIEELKETDVGDNWPRKIFLTDCLASINREVLVLCLLANAYRRHSVQKAVKVLDKVCTVFDVVSVAPAHLIGSKYRAASAYNA